MKTLRYFESYNKKDKYLVDGCGEKYYNPFYVPQWFTLEWNNSPKKKKLWVKFKKTYILEAAIVWYDKLEIRFKVWPWAN